MRHFDIEKHPIAVPTTWAGIASGVIVAVIYLIFVLGFFLAKPLPVGAAPLVTCGDHGCSEQAAPRASRRAPRHDTDGSGNPILVTVNTAAGIRITVHPTYAGKFQALIADLVAQGHKPRFITCYARGHKSGSNHAWGGACDIDQTGWGRTSGFMYRAGSTIRSNGLYDGCAFRDCGHVEAMRGLHNRPPNLYSAVSEFQGRAQ